MHGVKKKYAQYMYCTIGALPAYIVYTYRCKMYMLFWMNKLQINVPYLFADQCTVLKFGQQQTNIFTMQKPAKIAHIWILPARQGASKRTWHDRVVKRDCGMRPVVADMYGVLRLTLGANKMPNITYKKFHLHQHFFVKNINDTIIKLNRKIHCYCI